MKLLARLAVSALVALAVHFFSFWMVFAQLVPTHLLFAAEAAALVAGGAAGFWVWSRMDGAGQGVFATAAAWACVAGAIGFCGGFFGPMILTPEANQGPLLGLFITGPLGFLGGGVAGLIYGMVRRA